MPRSSAAGYFTVPEKGKELAWLHKSYNRFLEENRLIDQAGLILMAREASISPFEYDET